MAHAIAVAAEPAAEAAEQIDDDEDDEDRSKRHCILPRRDGIRRPAQKKAYPGLWFQRGNPKGLRALRCLSLYPLPLWERVAEMRSIEDGGGVLSADGNPSSGADFA